MKRFAGLNLALVCGLALAAPTGISAQVALHQCGFRAHFPTACATLHVVEFSGNQLTLVISNSSDAVDHPFAFIRFLLLEFEGGSVPGLESTDATVAYGSFVDDTFIANGDEEIWDVTDRVNGRTGGMGHGWDLRIEDETTGGAALQLATGSTVLITVNFSGSVDGLQLACGEPDCVGRGWTAHLQGLGLDGEGSAYSVVPEPVTMVLLATGLAGMGGVGLLRRRRHGGFELDNG